MRWTPLAPLAALAALAAPLQFGQRVPGGGGGSAVQAAAQVLAGSERPGDAIVYPSSGIPPWYLAYPQAFRPLRDISLSQTAAALGRLYAGVVPIPVLLRRERGVSRIWVFETGPPWQAPVPYLAPGFRLIQAWQLGHDQDQARLDLYQR